MNLSHKISVYCVSAQHQFDITSMAEMNRTQFPTSPNTSSSSWQADTIKGVQITATLVIFLVRNPLWLQSQPVP